MAYQTGGTGGTITDLMDAVRAFAVAQGWTVDKWDSVNKLLFLTKGLCAVSFKGFTNDTLRVYTGAAGSNLFTDGNPDHRLFMSLNGSNTPALTTYHSHPGSLVTSDKSSRSVHVNGLTGPFVAWHLFADATKGDHIHVVVQINAECFMHFSFGHLDKRGLTHSGVAYVTGVGNPWYRNVSNYLATHPSYFNDPSGVNIPFMHTGGSNSHQYGALNASPGILLKHVDAWPAAWGANPIQGNDGNAPHRGLVLPLARSSEIYIPSNYPQPNGQGAMLNIFGIAEPTPYSNVSPMFPLPVWRYYWNDNVAASNRICYVGDYPNVRAINLTNLQAGQEITVNTDTWMVFPALRQSAWQDRGVEPKPQSGQFGIAYKKV